MENDSLDPRRAYKTPAALMADPGLSDTEKQTRLIEWSSELDSRLNAESEGMGASDPISAKKEAQWADELRQVQTELSAISERETTTYLQK